MKLKVLKLDPGTFTLALTTYISTSTKRRQVSLIFWKWALKFSLDKDEPIDSYVIKEYKT